MIYMRHDNTQSALENCSLFDHYSQPCPLRWPEKWHGFPHVIIRNEVFNRLLELAKFPGLWSGITNSKCWVPLMSDGGSFKEIKCGSYIQKGLLENMQRIMSGIWIRNMYNIANITTSIGKVQRTWRYKWNWISVIMLEKNLSKRKSEFEIKYWQFSPFSRGPQYSSTFEKYNVDPSKAE